MRQLVFALIGLVLILGSAQALWAQVQVSDTSGYSPGYTAHYSQEDYVTGEVRLRVHAMPGEKYDQLVEVYIFTADHGEVANTLFLGNKKTRTYKCVNPDNASTTLTKKRDGTLALSVCTCQKAIDASILTEVLVLETQATFPYTTGIVVTCIPWGKDGTPGHPDGWPGKPGTPGSPNGGKGGKGYGNGKGGNGGAGWATGKGGDGGDGGDNGGHGGDGGKGGSQGGNGGHGGNGGLNGNGGNGGDGGDGVGSGDGGDGGGGGTGGGAEGDGGDGGDGGSPGGQGGPGGNGNPDGSPGGDG